MSLVPGALPNANSSSTESWLQLLYSALELHLYDPALRQAHGEFIKLN